MEEVGDRIQFYSADDVPVTPGQMEEGQVTPEELRRASKAPGPKRRTATPRSLRGGETGPQSAAPKKKPTVAILAQSLEEISQTLPALVTQVQNLSDRTAAMEAATSRAADRTSAMRPKVPLLNRIQKK